MDKQNEQLEDLVVETERAAEVKGGQDLHFSGAVIDPSNRSFVDPSNKSLSSSIGGV